MNPGASHPCHTLTWSLHVERLKGRENKDDLKNVAAFFLGLPSRSRCATGTRRRYFDRRCEIATGKPDRGARRRTDRRSASTPFVYKVQPGGSAAEKFIDASAEGPGTFFFGMLADTSTNTLWTCQLTPVPNATPVQRHTALRGFDLSTGAPRYAGICLATTAPATISRSGRKSSLYN